MNRKPATTLPMSERELSQSVVDLARVLKWKVHRTWLSIHSPAGMTDLILARKGQLLFVELKSEKGKLSPAQLEWIDALHTVGDFNEGVRTYVWRPSDWHSGRIEEALR
mgnify:CR=1 FL=1